MSQPGTQSRIVLAVVWLIVGSAMFAVPVWLGWTRWRVILTGNPTMLAAGIGCGLGGVVAVAWAIASLFLGARYDRERMAGLPARRSEQQLQRRAKWRIGLAVPALLVCVVLVGLLAWARPVAATAIAVNAAHSGNDVRVSDRLTWYEMTSARKNAAGNVAKPTVGLVFSPAARVDPRAYANLLRPLAAAGYLVVVLKEPFGFAIFHTNHAERVLQVHPEIASWAVGGHALGGAAASSFADSHGPQVKALLLYSSYPTTKVTRTDLKVMSISGSADGLTTPADIAASKPNLPARSQFVVIKGAVHSFFGDYGEQPGDGRPTVTRQAAQAQIVRNSQQLLASLVPPQKPKK
jgi:pimeloyl-ACP methyl ester carboxylesterase